MSTLTTVITAQIDRATLEAIERYLSSVAPGAAGYFASRSEFVREALRRQLEAVAPPSPTTPAIRKRTRANLAR